MSCHTIAYRFVMRNKHRVHYMRREKKNLALVRLGRQKNWLSRRLMQPN